MRRLLLSLIILVDAAVVLVLLNAGLLLLSNGPLGRWYGYWAEAVIAVYGVAGVMYMAAVLVLALIVGRDRRTTAAQKILWIAAATFFGYLVIPLYLVKQSRTPAGPS
jgi:uncharacterized membrane protein